MMPLPPPALRQRQDYYYAALCAELLGALWRSTMTEDTLGEHYF